MAMLDELKRQVMESQVWQSIFRHGYEDTPRNRILMVSGNVWLHLHPSKVRKHGTRLRFTWCMGGITFLMFLVTVITGVYLMFYYRPTAEYAYADMKYLEFDMPFGMLMRNMHRWAAHGMVIAVWLHMFRVWIIRNDEGFYAVYAKCTHLGCTPRWLATEAKFKCPCHGSGYYKSGVNFEGPAPRPMDRVRITKSEDGQLVVDVSVKYIYGTWDKPGAFLKV